MVHAPSHTYDDVIQYGLTWLDNHFILMKQNLNDPSNIHVIIGSEKHHLSVSAVYEHLVFLFSFFFFVVVLNVNCLHFL